MGNKAIKLVCLGIFLLQFLGCSGKDTSVEKATDPYIKDLKEMIPEANITLDKQWMPLSILQPHRIKPLEKGNLFVVVDEADKSISLINKEGNHLSETGGEGRGPQEFQNIAQLHVGYDGRIYLLDMLSFRITVFEVAGGTLKYIEALSYENPSNHSLHRIYVTEFGNYGVYNQTEGFQTPDNRFLLYRLDRQFTPKEELLKMPGHERQKVSNPEFTLYVPNDFLNRTFWDVDGEWFYYLSSHQSLINKYNLKTEQQKEVSYLQFKDRLNSHEYTDFIKERYDDIEDDTYWAALEESNILPLFSGFWVQDDKIILRMFYPAEEEGTMIYIDQNSEEVTYFRAPYELSQISLLDKKMYGLNFKDDNYQFISIELE